MRSHYYFSINNGTIVPLTSNLMWVSVVRRRVGSCCSLRAMLEQLPRHDCGRRQSAEEGSLTGVWVERAFVLAHRAHSTNTLRQLLPVMFFVCLQTQTLDGHQCDVDAFSEPDDVAVTRSQSLMSCRDR